MWTYAEIAHDQAQDAPSRLEHMRSTLLLAHLLLARPGEISGVVGMPGQIELDGVSTEPKLCGPSVQEGAIRFFVLHHSIVMLISRIYYDHYAWPLRTLQLTFLSPAVVV